MSTHNDDGSGNAAMSETQKRVASIKPGYPASALVNVLLQHYAADFGDYKRNVSFSNALWVQWNGLYEDLLREMGKVEGASNDADWEAFDLYTNAITPLELWVAQVFIGYRLVDPVM